MSLEMKAKPLKVRAFKSHSLITSYMHALDAYAEVAKQAKVEAAMKLIFITVGKRYPSSLS